MSDTVLTENIAAALRKLRSFGVVPRAASDLRDSADTAASTLFDKAIGDVDAYTDSANPDVQPELADHLNEQIVEVLRLITDHRPRELEFVGQYARRCAQLKFPLTAVLAAYRAIQQSLLDWLTDAALSNAHKRAQMPQVIAAVTEFVLAYSTACATLMTSEYVQHTRALAEAEGGQRSKLLSILLGGYDEADVHAAQQLRRAGYLQQRQSFCVVVARSVNPQEMQNAARAKRMADAVAESLAGLPLRTLVGIRDDQVIAVVSGVRRASGWTAPQTLLADRVYSALRTIGPSALIGLSADAPSTSHIPRALSEGKLALDFASVAARVVPYSQIPFRHMLARVAVDNMRAAMPTWLLSLKRLDIRSKGVLLTTLNHYADANMNALKAAKRLNVHPNTIYARFKKIEHVTGLNPLSYHELTEMLLAIECDALS